jgi:PelA/Pel-15E family pectate lyase
LVQAPARGEDAALRDEAAAALRKAATFYRTSVASHGGYVYYYLLDLSERWGEGKASRDQIWVQPPGTPTVGLAYLKAYAATNDRFYLDAAREAAEALVYGQLASGGWTNCVDFDPQGDRVAKYRNGKGRGKNNSTLDDGITQGAIQLLIHVDQALEFKPGPIHESARIALDALLKAQFANGGFPQVWTEPVSKQPIVAARFPDYDWRTEGKIKNYWDMYTLNDGLAGTVAKTLSDAFAIYGDVRYKAALARLGDFLPLAQLPEPQPAWSQQYNYAMQPIWARRFEPAAVTGGESQDVLETLLRIHRITGDAKYLEPFPRALSYLKRSVLPDGRLARYYELRTNRPLYMTRSGDDYRLTYDDSDLPAHYGWKVNSRLERIEKEYAALKVGGRPSTSTEAPASRALEPQVRAILRDLDDQGRWISTYTGERLVGQPKLPPKSRYLASEVFSRNIETLTEYLSATRHR